MDFRSMTLMTFLRPAALDSLAGDLLPEKKRFYPPQESTHYRPGKCPHAKAAHCSQDRAALHHAALCRGLGPQTATWPFVRAAAEESLPAGHVRVAARKTLHSARPLLNNITHSVSFSTSPCDERVTQKFKCAKTELYINYVLLDVSLNLSRVNNRRNWKSNYINTNTLYTSKRRTIRSHYLDYVAPVER